MAGMAEISFYLAFGLVLPYPFLAYVLTRYSKHLSASVVSASQVVEVAQRGSAYDFFQSDIRKNVSDLPNISVVIAARNEEKYIAACIDSVQSCGYPPQKFEIFVVDDHSTDRTRHEVFSRNYANVNYTVLPDHLAGKKAAITFGVSLAQHPIIACTDADCRVPEGWLGMVAGALQGSDAVMITGPVLTEGGDTLLRAFQRMDLAATMLLTVVGIARRSWSLANGANMAFTAQFFSESGGFQSSASNPSGDDVFLAANAALKGMGRLAYAGMLHPVLTKAESSWSELWRQRRRWASKSFAIAQNGLIPLQMIVFASALSCVISVVVSCFVDGYSIIFTLIPIGIKCITDLFILQSVEKNTKWDLGLRWFFPAFPFHIAHLLHSAFAAIKHSPFTWKERKWGTDVRKTT